MVSSFLHVLMAADAVWKCVHVFVSVKIVGVLLCLGVLAVMRKLAARMQVAGASGGIKAAQLTRAQKIIILGLALNSVGYVIAPGWNLWAVTEIMLCTSMIMEGWTHFIAFERTVKDTFGEMAPCRIQSAPSAAPQQSTSNQTFQRLQSSSKRVRSAKTNVGRHVRLLFLFFHMVVGCVFAYSPLWSANKISPGECQVRLF
jgi:hypothetical protein